MADHAPASSSPQPPSREPTRAPRGSRAARTRGFTLFRLRGVPVRIDLSWFIIAGLVAFTYGDRMATDIAAMRDASLAVIIVAATAAAILFFASLLAHELGHAFTSLDRDIPVLGITLFLLGGVTESKREARTARDEFVIVGIGPFISLVLAAVFGLLYTAVREVPAPAAVLGYLAWTNLALAVFNVLPGYPLDGGRLLRSVLWMVTGRPHRSTMWAARVGQIFAAILIVGAVWGFLGLPIEGPRWFRITVAIVASVGLWGGLIGLFLFRGASDAYRSARLRNRLTGHAVRDVMGSVPPTIDPDASLADVVDDLARKPSLPWPVGDPVRAVIRLRDLDAVPSDRWSSTSVGAIASPLGDVQIDASLDLERAVQRLAAAPEQQLVVTEHGRAVGLLTESLLVVR